ncbi:uncharacterized protein stbd1 isoform X2 [Acanthochromis polyacanthus]|uniref:uncharacterized protein stbd1 isoform X2 n=1 Tax=Acanthochromis polyacanthus TaxID=80966 RepID=UPI002234C2AD|nr:uncharacterized protein stbd1 isoform X2 [Acanthochromis polyacanthus]
MSLKNGNTVERRMDLASLFCMIGRHGPAVALAVIAVVSVLAGFVLYRTVRGKRRKARAGGDGSSGEERDAGLVQTEEPEEPEEPRSPTEEPRSPTEEPRSPTESTAENNLLPDISSAVQDEVAENNRRRETCTVAGVENDGWNQGDALRDADEDGRRLKLQLTDKESYVEEEKVLPAECQEDVTADKDSYNEDNLQNVLENPVCCEQKLHMSENGGGDDEATEHTNKTESHLEELVVHIEDIRVCYSKDPENPHPEDTSHSNYYSDDLLSPEEEGENEVEDDQVIAQPAEMVYSTSEQETNQSEVLSSQNSDQDHECGQTSEESQDVQEDLLSNLPDVHFDAHMLQQHLQIEQNNGEGLTWNEEDHVVEGEVLSDSSAKVKEEEEETTPVLDKDAVLDVPAPDLTSLKEELQSEKNQGSVAQEGNLPSSQLEQCDEVTAEESDQNDGGLNSKTTKDMNEIHLKNLTNVRFDSSTLQQQLQTELQSDLTSSQQDSVVKEEMLTSVDEEPEPEKTDGMCGTTVEPRCVDFPELSSDFPPSVEEDEATPALDKNADLSPLSLDVPSFAEEIQSEWKESDTAVVLAEETVDKVMSSSSKGQQSDPMDNEESLERMGDQAALSTETSHPDIPSTVQDKQNDQNNADLPEVGASAAPVKNKPPLSSNQDMFGHEVEDSYNRAMDQFLEEMAAKVKHNEKKKQIDVKAVETKEEGAKEKEEDYEKTEISIMEATMDNNEWITDGNYQVLPWMNFSVPSFIQNHTKTEPVPREEPLHSSFLAEAPCIDAVIPLPVVEQTNTVSLLDESLENGKKVVAVQPMPQNVNVIFRIHYHTHSPYQKVAVTGNQQELGNWKEFIPLERAEDGLWSSVVSLPAESHVEWKFVVVDKGDVCRWEECGNRLLDTGSGDDLLVHRWWGIL